MQLLLMCGGASPEHEISIISAQSIIKNLDDKKYDVKVIVVSRLGQWWILNQPEILSNIATADDLTDDQFELITLCLGHTNPFKCNQEIRLNPTIIFPIFHGRYGEDGPMQGLFDLINVPYVGANQLSAGIAMDKDMTKRLLMHANISVVDYLLVTEHKINTFDPALYIDQLGLPLFVKPANTGSSVGITKVKTLEELKPAIVAAMKYCSKVIVEKFIPGLEIECAVLGNEKPVASLPARLIPNDEFYTYHAKYLDPNGVKFEIPAQLPRQLIEEIQTTATRAFEVIDCHGMLRVDFFVDMDNHVYVNEVNPIPGFTSVSLYPKMWEYSGLSYSELLDKLILLSLERFKSVNEKQAAFLPQTPSQSERY